MDTTSETYRPFYNRRVAQDIRQLIVDRDDLVQAAARLPMRHFAKPALPAVVNVTPFRRRFFGDSESRFARVA